MTSDMLRRMEEFIVKADGNITHVKRVHYLSELLAEKESVPHDGDVLAFAAYFHDLAAYRPYTFPGMSGHAEESAKIVPGIAADFGFDAAQTEIIVEAVRYHDKAGKGKFNETRLLRNADGIDYLGYMAAARDFAKFPNDMKKALDALKTRKAMFFPLIDYKSAEEMAAPRVVELDRFIAGFEEECLGI